MAKEAIVQIRMDSALKNEVEQLYKKLGTSFAEAVRIFATQSVEFGSFPMPIQLKKTNNHGLGIAKGKLKLPDDFDDYDSEIENLFYGG